MALRVRFLTELPPQAERITYCIYLIRANATQTYCDVYVTGGTTAVTNFGNTNRINELIASSSAGNNNISIVDNIAGRDAIVQTESSMVIVKDASADANVNSGAALYFWDATASQYIKLAEYENMDVVQSWNNLSNIPVVLTELGKDANGNLTLNDTAIQAGNATEADGLNIGDTGW